MTETETLDKRTVILDAAFKVFLAYGFRRTTMADIADAAGISRPALYLEFKNKADIYRAGFMAMMARTCREVDQALKSKGTLCDRLVEGLNVGVVASIRRVQQSPHGAELFEVKQELAGDLGEEWNEMIEQTLEQAIVAAVESGEIRLEGHNVEAGDIARLIVSGVEGIKKRMSDWHQAEADIARIIDLMVRPLVRPI